MLDPRWRRLARLRLYCNASSIGAIVFGFLVLCGWASRNELLISGFVGSGSIAVNTALGLMLLGASTWLLLPDPPETSRRNGGLFFAALAASIGGITLIEYAFRLNLRIDELFFRQPGDALAIYPPGRMPPITATAFLALGLALLALDFETRMVKRPAQALTLWGAFVGIMSLSGYINGASALYNVFSFAPVHVLTAVVLFIISADIFFARPKVGLAGDLTGKFSGSAVARRFLPATFLVPIGAAWLRAQLQRAGVFGPNLGLAFNVTMNVATLSVLVWIDARKLNQAEHSLETTRQAKDRLFDASLKDELTGLYNRRGFLTFAEEQIKLACSGRRELLVVFADVDGLKAINDGFGHGEGDRALKKAAEVLLAVFRDTDLVARLGGDEFVILALDCSPAGLTRINAHVEKLLRAVNKGDNPWKLQISIGATHVDAEHQLSLNELLSAADKMMYEQKRSHVIAVVN